MPEPAVNTSAVRLDGVESEREDLPETVTKISAAKPPKHDKSSVKEDSTVNKSILAKRKALSIMPRREDFDATRESLHRTLKSGTNVFAELDTMEKKLAMFDTGDLTQFSKKVANLAKISP